MNAEIITIGDEILLGQIVDTNSVWLSQQLGLLQIIVNQITSISDKSEAIQNALLAASKRADLIIVTGGLGPTRDDVTKQTISSYFNKPLVRDAQVLQHVQTLFARVAPNKEMPLVNQSQADILEGCEVLFNDVGTAPGMLIREEGKLFVFMPGVPFEMKYLYENRLLPILKQNTAAQHIQHRHIITIGLGESFLAEKIADIENSLPSHMKLAYLPKVGLVRLRLTQIGGSDEEIDIFHNRLLDRLGQHVVSIRDIPIEHAIVEEFTKSKMKLAVAESCTGGSLAGALTAIAGSSAVFDCGVVAYHNKIKQSVLGVKEYTLETYGAVSEQTVIEMAEGVKKIARADYTIATSGVAGPGGGTAEKPVGTVWIAVSGKSEIQTKLFRFHNNRSINIERTIAQAFAMLWNLYIKELRN